MQDVGEDQKQEIRDLIQTGRLDAEGLATLRQLYPKLRAGSDEESIFLMTCNRTLLDPFARQIYPVWRRTKENDQWVEKMQVQVSIDGFRIQAERSHKYDSQVGPYWCGPDAKWVDVWLSEKPPAAAKVGVWRKGAREPIWGIATYREYVQKTNQGGPNRMWGSMPANMLAKCAEALALRRALPYELSGLYSEDELGQADNPVIDHQPGDDTLKKIGAEAVYRMGPEAQDEYEAAQASGQDGGSSFSTTNEEAKPEAPKNWNGGLYPLGDSVEVTSKDDPDYLRFEEIRDVAAGEDIKVSPVRLPYQRTRFVVMYVSLLNAANTKRRARGAEDYVPKDPNALPPVLDADPKSQAVDLDEGDAQPEPATEQQISLILGTAERKGVAEVEIDGRTYTLDTITENELPKMVATQIIALLNEAPEVPTDG